jgi:hypothetical protein
MRGNFPGRNAGFLILDTGRGKKAKRLKEYSRSVLVFSVIIAIRSLQDNTAGLGTQELRY